MCRESVVHQRERLKVEARVRMVAAQSLRTLQATPHLLRDCNYCRQTVNRHPSRCSNLNSLATACPHHRDSHSRHQSRIRETHQSHNPFSLSHIQLPRTKQSPFLSRTRRPFSTSLRSTRYHRRLVSCRHCPHRSLAIAPSCRRHPCQDMTIS